MSSPQIHAPGFSIIIMTYSSGSDCESNLMFVCVCVWLMYLHLKETDVITSAWVDGCERKHEQRHTRAQFFHTKNISALAVTESNSLCCLWLYPISLHALPFTHNDFCLDSYPGWCQMGGFMEIMKKRIKSGQKRWKARVQSPGR